MGIYAQDKWTLRRLTVTGGVRFDYFNTRDSRSVSARVAVGWRALVRGVARRPELERHQPAGGRGVRPVWEREDGDQGERQPLRGRTDLCVCQQHQSIRDEPSTPRRAPGSTSTADLIPQGDPLNPLPNGEFSGTIDPNFGKSIITTRYDPDVSQGWGKRPYNWEYSASVQHELLPRVSLEVGYFRRTFGNQTVTDNLDVTPADFDQFCITAPTDLAWAVSVGVRCAASTTSSPRRPAFASNQIITFAKNYSGETSQTYDGVDVTVNARPTGRLFLQAGVSTGRTVTKNCALVDNPQTLRFCEVRQPFLGNYRVSGGYTFPWQMQVSGVFQSLPPDPVAAPIGHVLLTVTNATPGITLGRPIATPGGVITVPLVDPSNYTDYGDRVNQVDLRVTKGVRVGRYRVDVMADFYNVFNVAPVLTYTTTYGPDVVDAADVSCSPPS